jgi:hypothetical protein
MGQGAGSRVETRRFQAMGQTGFASNCTVPHLAAREDEGRERRAGEPEPLPHQLEALRARRQHVLVPHRKRYKVNLKAAKRLEKSVFLHFSGSKG